MLREHDRSNFDTLARAFDNRQVALVEVRRRSDGEAVAAVCSVGQEGGDFIITPFAVMVEGNPFELFDPPDTSGGFVDDGGDGG